MIGLPRVAVAIACHNRKAKTLVCLDSLRGQTPKADTQVLLFDDGSTDGTVEAVRRLHPEVEIIEGRGDAFWAGGMRIAFDAARRKNADFCLWLNDDVRLAPGALSQLLATHRGLARQGHALSLVGGAVADPLDGRTSYAGIVRPFAMRPLRFRRADPDPRTPVRCDTLVGNVVLVPQATAEAIGGIDSAFRHTLADLDYGLRVTAAGGWVGLAPGHVGWCERNTRRDRWFNGDLSLPARWRLLFHPLGFPLRPWLHFARRHGGPCWLLFGMLPFWRLVTPLWVSRPVDRWRLRSSPASTRHA